MNVCSLEFLLGLLALGAIVFWLPSGRPRQVLLAACNTGFLFTAIPNLSSWAALAVFLFSGYFIAILSRRVRDQKSRTILQAVYLSILLLSFIVLKEYRFISFIIQPGSISRWVSIVGLSYMLFRQIHFIVDCAENQIERPSLWAYLNYQLNLFTLWAGPIDRYQEFVQYWNSTRPILTDPHEQKKAYARILIGVLQVAFVGSICLDYAQRATLTQLHATHPRDLLKFAVFFYGYPGYIYFNFSGYCDIVIGGASLVGMRLPENFNRPYIARNVIDFWARWHMTLTHWIRDYVFTPLYKNGVERWPEHGKTLSYCCYFIALFLAGIWHGGSWNFVVFGLLHGCGVSMTKIWEENIIRREGRPGLKKYMKSTRIRWASVVLTFHFVCFTMLFFPPGLRARTDFLRRFIHDPSAATMNAGHQVTQ